MNKKEQLIKALAEFCVNNQAHKSILLEMGNSIAVEWAAIRHAIPNLSGYPTVEEAEEAIREFLT